VLCYQQDEPNPNIDAHHKKPVHCPKAKTKKQKRRKHRKHKSPQNHDKSKSRASASPASLPQNIFASLWSSKSYQASRRPAAAPGSSQRSCWASEMALKAWVGGRATENRDIAMDGQRRSGATGRGKTLLTKLALAHQRLRRSSPSITRPVAPPQDVRLRTILARSKKLHIQYRCASQKTRALS
jgi:hypothetical protein